MRFHVKHLNFTQSTSTISFKPTGEFFFQPLSNSGNRLLQMSSLTHCPKGRLEIEIKGNGKKQLRSISSNIRNTELKVANTTGSSICDKI